MIEEERILVTVRTYPNISATYTETVCTGGVNDRGEWRRLYPVPLRYLHAEGQYRTYDIIRVQLKPGKDGRAETRCPQNQTLRVIDHLTDHSVRHRWISPTIDDSLNEFCGKNRTIGPVRVAEVLEFISEPVSPDWTEAEKQKLAQLDLFENRKPLAKIPFKFRLRWKDGDSKEHVHTFISWEVFETWRAWSSQYSDVELRIQEQWMNKVFSSNHDISFFMGNLAKYRNVFMVCGTYQPPKDVTSNASLF